MSINDQDGNEIIRLGTVHAWAFKVALYFAPIFAVWLVVTIIRHDREIAVLQSQIRNSSAVIAPVAVQRALAGGGE